MDHQIREDRRPQGPKKLAAERLAVVAQLRARHDRPMTSVLEDLRGWRAKAESGPQLWQDAWDRVLDVVDPLWQRYGEGILDQTYAEGGVGLTLAVYLAAADTGLPVSAIRREHVDAAIGLESRRKWGVVMEHWEDRLRGLGHDLDSPADPVAECYRFMARDCRPPREDWDNDLLMSDPTVRWGTGISTTLPYVLHCGGPEQSHLMF